MVKIYPFILLGLLSYTLELTVADTQTQDVRKNSGFVDKGSLANSGQNDLKYNCPMEDISMDDGNDDNYFDKLEDVDSYLLCGIFCARTSKCNFWTWFESSVSPNAKHDCLLFEANAQTKSISYAWSGENNCPYNMEKEPSCPKHYSVSITKFGPQQPLDEISFDDGQTSNFKDLIKGVGNKDLCGELCARTTICVYWTWYASSNNNREGGDCVMFDNLSELHHDSYAVSGDKYYPNTNPEDYCPGASGAIANYSISGFMKWFGIATHLSLIGFFRM